jgi:16S rRNA (guanine966-N2)-methyltransferase
MRIITGKARNIPLKTLEGDDTRPTSERVKEAVFSMLQFEIEGRRVLDLFAGSGQLGLEALSRGASHATFIDNSRAASDIIIGNAKKAGLFELCRVSASDYASALRGNAGRESYDIVFIDPPYDSMLVPNALRLLVSGKMLAPHSVVVCESRCASAPKRKKRSEESEQAEIYSGVFGEDDSLASAFDIRKSSAYGITRITLLEPKMQNG